jgi:hypothetical protein
MAPPKPARSFSLAPPLNITGADSVVVGTVEFAVAAAVLVLVSDTGAVVTVIPEHVSLSVTVVKTLVKVVLAVDAGAEVEDVEADVEVGVVEAGAEVEDEITEVDATTEETGLDTGGPLQAPSTQVL